MEYNRVIDYLFSQLTVYQRDGASAYKPGLATSLALSRAFGRPETSYATIHIAGTNGKGSTAHTLAAILQSAGYRTGLYTSPHLVDFRERIRVNGEKITEEGVVGFMERYFNKKLDINPSFFELTMMMAFDWFKNNNVDIAVIETGLGGRLDSTNIISPILSVITNISFDHTAFLGDTLESIAAEKAGIIKKGVPVVIGEAEGKVREVFQKKADAEKAPIYFVDDSPEILSVSNNNEIQEYVTHDFGTIRAQLTGDCQRKNADTVLLAVNMLRKMGWKLTDQAVRSGFERVCTLTGLMGRWMIVGKDPLVVADTGHNCGGWEYTVNRLNGLSGIKRLVIGFVNDKDITGIMTLISRIDNALVYAARADINRALPAQDVAAHASAFSLPVACISDTVIDAYQKALADSGESDVVFVGGSNFVVADFLSFNP